MIKTEKKTKTKKKSGKKVLRKTTGTKKSLGKKKTKIKSSGETKKGKRLDEKFLKAIEKKLLEEKERLLELVDLTRQEEENLTTGVEDEVENAETSLEKEILFALSDREKMLLNDINLALRKINSKDYGVCELCGIDISKKRLKAIPYARYCIKCASKL